MSIDWNDESVDAHRRGISDCEWDSMQPKGEPSYLLGDVIEFQVGGFGIITKVHKGWCNEYATEPIKGRPGHPTTKHAWHNEGDFKRLYRHSPLRSI